MKDRIRVKGSAEDNAALVETTKHSIRYHPYGASRDLFHCHDDEILLAGPAGTGKSLSALQKIHLMLSKYPNSKGFMARKTRVSMTNSCLHTFRRQVLKPYDNVHLHKQDQVFNYPNGSILAIIGLDDPERIKSTDWDVGFIQEATECTENDMEICTTRLRNWEIPYQQIIMDCNPDKPTHWIKKRCDNGLTKMLVSVHKDNPRLWDHIHKKWTSEGQAYLAKLERLSGPRRARLYLGLWAAAEGLIYEGWDPDIHMLNLSELPADWGNWPHYWVIDFGFTHPFVWQDWIQDPRGRMYLLHQIYRTQRLVEDHAADIMEISDGVIPRAIICDHDAEGRATLERHTGYITLPAYKSIQPGVEGVKARLRKDWDGKPGLFIIRDSLVHEDETLKAEGKPVKTEDEWDGYVWDLSHNERANSKRDELPIDKDNHGMDDVRYMTAFVDDLAIDPQDQESIIVYDEEVTISPY